ncbi:Hypothetical predicted protein [Lecanosticta acicola]|uniref:Uncharacterized protein n=1 Tax=Lecanosticta acicola TaxID=111012 RepID=A0AAI8YRD2_9PEZI|nr:Hypothetical predicted protein [Lecanosticta acicola]
MFASQSIHRSNSLRSSTPPITNNNININAPLAVHASTASLMSNPPPKDTNTYTPRADDDSSHAPPVPPSKIPTAAAAGTAPRMTNPPPKGRETCMPLVDYDSSLSRPMPPRQQAPVPPSKIPTTTHASSAPRNTPTLKDRKTYKPLAADNDDSLPPPMPLRNPPPIPTPETPTAAYANIAPLITQQTPKDRKTNTPLADDDNRLPVPMPLMPPPVPLSKIPAPPTPGSMSGNASRPSLTREGTQSTERSSRSSRLPIPGSRHATASAGRASTSGPVYSSATSSTIPRLGRKLIPSPNLNKEQPVKTVTYPRVDESGDPLPISSHPDDYRRAAYQATARQGHDASPTPFRTISPPVTKRQFSSTISASDIDDMVNEPVANDHERRDSKMSAMSRSTSGRVTFHPTASNAESPEPDKSNEINVAKCSSGSPTHSSRHSTRPSSRPSSRARTPNADAADLISPHASRVFSNGSRRLSSMRSSEHPPPTSPFMDPLPTISSQPFLSTAAPMPATDAERGSEDTLREESHQDDNTQDTLAMPSPRRSLFRTLSQAKRENEQKQDRGERGLSIEAREHLHKTLAQLEGKVIPDNPRVSREQMRQMFGNVEEAWPREESTLLSKMMLAQKYLDKTAARQSQPTGSPTTFGERSAGEEGPPAPGSVAHAKATLHERRSYARATAASASRTGGLGQKQAAALPTSPALHRGRTIPPGSIGVPSIQEGGPPPPRPRSRTRDALHRIGGLWRKGGGSGKPASPAGRQEADIPPVPRVPERFTGHHHQAPASPTAASPSPSGDGQSPSAGEAAPSASTRATVAAIRAQDAVARASLCAANADLCARRARREADRAAGEAATALELAQEALRASMVVSRR